MIDKNDSLPPDEHEPDPLEQKPEPEPSRAGGLRTDFFIANLAELARMDLHAGPRFFPVVPARRVDPLTIADLDLLLTGEPERLPAVLREAGAEGPWVALIDEVLCQALVKTQTDQNFLNQAADQWAESEGWDAGIGPPEDLPTLLKDLSELCLRAIEEQKRVFVWIAT